MLIKAQSLRKLIREDRTEDVMNALRQSSGTERIIVKRWLPELEQRHDHLCQTKPELAEQERETFKQELMQLVDQLQTQAEGPSTPDLPADTAPTPTGPDTPEPEPLTHPKTTMMNDSIAATTSTSTDVYAREVKQATKRTATAAKQSSAASAGKWLTLTVLTGIVYLGAVGYGWNTYLTEGSLSMTFNVGLIALSVVLVTVVVMYLAALVDDRARGLTAK